jgi:hypothetical protein
LFFEKRRPRALAIAPNSLWSRLPGGLEYTVRYRVQVYGCTSCIDFGSVYEAYRAFRFCYAALHAGADPEGELVQFAGRAIGLRLENLLADQTNIGATARTIGPQVLWPIYTLTGADYPPAVHEARFRNHR